MYIGMSEFILALFANVRVSETNVLSRIAFPVNMFASSSDGNLNWST